ncbi:MAG: glycosyltransferase family A protein [Victivallaceae bacterium]
MKRILFSLIIGFTGRSECLKQLFKSLEEQQLKDFEVILIDQTLGTQLDEVISVYRDCFAIKKINAYPARGVSIARNVGLLHADGEWCAFPDDDCIYPADLLKNIKTWLNQHSDYCGLSCIVTDCNNKFSAGGYMSRRQMDIGKHNVWRTVVSPSLFLKTDVVLGIKGFDERLGIGVLTNFGGGEETDLVMRLVETGGKIFYVPDLTVWHPRYIGNYDNKRILYGWTCGCGCGAVMKIHQWSYLKSFYFASLLFLRAFQQLMLLRLRRAVYHFAMGFGRLYGRVAFK